MWICIAEYHPGPKPIPFGSMDKDKIIQAIRDSYEDGTCFLVFREERLI